VILHSFVSTLIIGEKWMKWSEVWMCGDLEEIRKKKGTP
jgi:hypothetical protein